MDKIYLDVRGKRLEIEKDVMLSLPESVLLCLFPTGVNFGDTMDADEVIYVEFDGDCLEYLLHFFERARYDFYGAPTSALRQQRQLAEAAAPQGQLSLNQNPLFYKQAIIVLREELEYFAIPPPVHNNAQHQQHELQPATDEHGNANQPLMNLKAECGSQLLGRKSIFTALQRNVNRENNVAEQHLIDMLCMSGFERDNEWGYRSMEPNRCCITSIALVPLKTGISQPAVSAGPNTAYDLESQGSYSPPEINVNSTQLATAQKLLLFWRKPARKCWWDALDIEAPSTSGKTVATKVHVRRIWTLELSCI